MPNALARTGGRLLTRYRSLPEPARIVGTACLGAAIGYVTYVLIFAINPLPWRAPTSWLLAFLVNVTRQYSLHRVLTFSATTAYWPSLGRAYVMYSGSAVATTTLNWYLTVERGVDHQLAWLACIGVTALISLVFLKRYVFQA
jgi:putative flippase GtrA